MDENIVKSIAKQLRPLLVGLANAVLLPEGILGIAFTGLMIKDRYPVFAEYVGPERTPERADEDRKRDETIRPVHYTLNMFHPIVRCLVDNGEKCVLLKREDAERIQNDPTRADVWKPLITLFRSSDAVPQNIRVWRYWLTDKKSALYYLPYNQDDNIQWWDELSRVSILATHAIRMSILMLCVSQELSREEADLFLNCLSMKLPYHEQKLFELLQAREVYQRAARDVKLRVKYHLNKNSVIIEAERLGTQMSQLLCLRPPKKGLAKSIDFTWIKELVTQRGPR